MTGVEAELKIENGGGNQQAIFDITAELFDLGNNAEMRTSVWNGLMEIDCDRFYMENGTKVTRPLKGMLIEVFSKASVDLVFAEFCKRVGNIYARVNATAELRDSYFQEDDCQKFGDDGSCFSPRGCNKQHGKLIDASPCTGVITIKPVDRYAKGRMIVWFKNPTTAHLINKYSRDGEGRELPHSVYARALEVLTRTQITWHRNNRDTIPIYLNNNPMICTTKDGTNFSAVIDDYTLKCTQCGDHYEHYDSPQLMCHSCKDEDEDSCTCENCGHHMNNDDSYTYNDYYYCETCYRDIAFYCECCSTDCDRDDAVSVVDSRGRDDGLVCSDCASTYYSRCNHCDEYQHNDHIVTTENGENYCQQCAEEHTRQCKTCSEISDDLDDFDDDGNCSGCHQDKEAEAS